MFSGSHKGSHRKIYISFWQQAPSSKIPSSDTICENLKIFHLSRSQNQDNVLWFIKAVKPRADEQVFLDKFYLLPCVSEKESVLKASRTSFSTRQENLLVCIRATRNTYKGFFVYVLNSCGLVKVVKKKYCQISRTQGQIKPVKENLFEVEC